MPRGKPKKGQFAFTLWYPGGGSMGVKSTRDHSPEEWLADVRKYCALMLESAEIEAGQRKAEDTP